METKEWIFEDLKAELDPNGPWMSEPDKIQWLDKETGYPCIIRRSHGTGALCGYVGVNKNHPFFEKDYDEFEEINVHGGLTHADFCQEGEPERGICHVTKNHEKVWWFGFDCAHFGDLIPLGGSIFRLTNEAKKYRDVTFVRKQVSKLAHQLKKVEK